MSELDEDITDYLFNTNLSIKDIAKELSLTELEVRNKIKTLGLDWVRRRAFATSRGQAALTTMLRKLIPGEKIVNEEPIGERLRLDIYCPRYQLAVEYHGRQHYEFVPHFHGDIQGFHESQKRDDRKQELCQLLGIALVVFRYNEPLVEDIVYERILEVLVTSPLFETNGGRKQISPFYEAWKKRKREYQKECYKRMKGTK